MGRVDDRAGVDLEAGLAVVNEVVEQVGLDLAAGLDRRPIAAARLTGLVERR